MKKSTIYLLAAAIVLAVVAFIATRKTAKITPRLDIDGYATAEELEADKKRGMLDPEVPVKSPIDEIILEQADGIIHLVRIGEGDDAKWRLKAPVDAPATKWQVEALVALFKSPTTRSDARTLKSEQDLSLFDLEAGRRIGLTLKSKGAVWNGVELIIGQAVKGDGAPSPEDDSGGVKGTWVMKKADTTVAFLVADKDLRTACAKTLADFRNKVVFDATATDMTRVEVTDPSGAKVALDGVASEVPAPAPEPGKPAPKPTKKVTWTLVEPAGVKADAGVEGIARSLANVAVKEFVPLAKATDEAKKALEGPHWVVSVTAGGVTAKVHVADGDKEPVWARVEGRDELMSLTSYSAKQLQKGLDEMKDKTVWDVSKDAVTELTVKGEAGAVTVAKVADGWSFTQPALPYAADPTGVLSQVAKLSAMRWARGSEVAAARAALANPETRAELVVGATRYPIAISGPLTEGSDNAQNRWAVVGDATTGEPFLLADFTAKRFTTTIDGLRQKKLFPQAKDAIASVTVQLAGRTEVAKLEKPSDPAAGGDLTLVDVPAGKSVDSEAVRTLIATLGSLEAKTFHEGKAPEVTGLVPEKAAKIVVTMADGKTATLLVATTSSGESEVFAQVDAGPLANTPIGINEYQAKNLTKGVGDLVKDAAPAGP
jgi:hypothetical protein